MNFNYVHCLSYFIDLVFDYHSYEVRNKKINLQFLMRTLISFFHLPFNLEEITLTILNCTCILVVVLIISCGAISEQTTKINWVFIMQIPYLMMLENVIPDSYVFSRDKELITSAKN